MPDHLTLSPQPKTGYLQMTHAGFPGNIVFLNAWENAYYLNWAANAWRPVTRKPPTWHRVSDGGLQRQLADTDGCTIDLSLSPGPDRLDIDITVENHTADRPDPFWGTYTMLDFWLSFCVHYKDAPLFDDPTFERTCISVNDEVVPVCCTDRSTTYKGVGPAYWLDQAAPRLRNLPDSELNYSAGISPTTANARWIGVASKDEARSLLVGFERVHHLWANCRQPVHGCMHSEPLIGDVEPGQTRRVRGSIWMGAFPLSEAIDRFNARFADSMDVPGSSEPQRGS